MKTKTKKNRAGFTLIEILAVIAIVGILASIIIPAAGLAKEAALRRRAGAEIQSIKVAAMQFYDDHRYMPWPTAAADDPKVGADQWTTGAADQEPVMELLTGDNAMKKLYLQIPDKSKASGQLVFNDPWGQPYQIGMDRDLDGAVEVSGTGVWDGQTVMEKVLVFSPGPPDQDKPMKSFDAQ